MAQTTVKDFAKTLKISEEALLKRMSSAGLSHSSSTDEVTAAHKQILLRSLKQKQKQTIQYIIKLITIPYILYQIITKIQV